MTIAAGALSFPTPARQAWIGLGNKTVNGIQVAPFLDTSGAYVFTGALVLRAILREDFTSSLNDLRFYVPTLGNSPIIPLCCAVYAFVLYAFAADQTLNCSVNVF